MTSPRLLVTGAAGFIGSNFLEVAARHGARLVVLDALTYAGHRENLSSDAGKAATFVQGDIGDRALVDRLLQEHQPTALLNFAAESHVDKSIEGPGAFVKTNIEGTFTLLSASLAYWKNLAEPARSGFRFLQVSTDEVYGSLGPVGKFSETTRYEPNSPYSASKAAADHLVRAWHHTYGLPTITTNCSNNYGPRQFPEKLIPHMILCALSDRPLPVYGDGGNVRDWIHVSDHCEGIWRALGAGRPGETYCFGGNCERDNLTIVRGICAELDRVRPRKDGKSYTTQIAFVADRPGHDRRYAIDDAKAVRELGFVRAMSDVEAGLKQTIRWYLDNMDWSKAVMSKPGSKVTYDWGKFA